MAATKENAVMTAAPGTSQHSDQRPAMSMVQMIPVSPLLDFFVCPICISTITDAHLTVCGHAFCGPCITEWIDRAAECPQCRHALIMPPASQGKGRSGSNGVSAPAALTPAPRDQAQSPLIKCHLMDNLYASIEKARGKQSEAYISRLIAGAGDVHSNGGKGGKEVQTAGMAKNEQLSPIEAIFQRRMQQSLTGFQAYFTDLQAEHAQVLATLEVKHETETAELKAKLNVVQRMTKERALDDGKGSGGQGPDSTAAAATAVDKDQQLHESLPITVLTRSNSAEQTSQAIMNVKMEYMACVDMAERRFRHRVGLLTNAYDALLARIPPSPFLMPLRAVLVVPVYNIRCDITLKSTDMLGEVVLTRLISATAGTKCEVIDVSHLRLFRKKEEDVVRGATTEKIDESLMRTSSAGAAPSASVLADGEEELKGSASVIEQQLKQGTHIIVRGDFSFKGQEAPQCFSLVYKKASKQTATYFACKDCKLNWVCATCAEHCHAGHSISMFMKSIVPSYPCCYCAKKNICSIDNIKGRKKAKLTS